MQRSIRAIQISGQNVHFIKEFYQSPEMNGETAEAEKDLRVAQSQRIQQQQLKMQWAA